MDILYLTFNQKLLDIIEDKIKWLESQEGGKTQIRNNLKGKLYTVVIRHRLWNNFIFLKYLFQNGNLNESILKTIYLS